MNLFAQEDYINRTHEMRSGAGDVYETFTSNKGELFRAFRKEYGRCVSKVYLDGKDGKSRAIGWVFQSRAKYEDADETYLREVWVTLHTAPPTKTTEYHYV